MFWLLVYIIVLIRLLVSSADRRKGKYRNLVLKIGGMAQFPTNLAKSEMPGFWFRLKTTKGGNGKPYFSARGVCWLVKRLNGASY